MSNQKSLFKLGDQVRIIDTDEKGVVINLDRDGKPSLVLVGNKTVNVIDKVVQHLSSFIAVWRFIKSVFKF